jgi:tripartite ATP-independent transporter DctP family solute receptor
MADNERGMLVDRRRFAAGAGAAAVVAGLAALRAPRAGAALSYRYGTDQSTISPVTVRAKEMWSAIERETGGALAVETFSDSVLGGDSQMLEQLRSGAIHFLTLPGAVLGSIAPAAQLIDTAFVFKDERQAYAAVDGDLGAFVRQQITGHGLVCLPHPWDNGFRDITANRPIRTAADLDGLKIRVPESPAFVDLFRTLGASPTPMDVSELYTALQTHVVDAQENALINIEQSRIYEVQKTLNFSHHTWSCWWFVVNADAWNALGSDTQAVVQRNIVHYGDLQRRDTATLSVTLVRKLKQQGMTAYDCDVESFRAKLSPYYARLKAEYGPTGWSLLEKYAGTLS